MSGGNHSTSENKKSIRNKKRRPGDPWISKNRVLVGNGGARMKHSVVLGRNPNFDTDETKVLIQLWGDPKVQRQLITTHKKYTVIAELSAKMEEYGYFRTPEEITTRIKNLKCIYNRLKKEVDSGEYTQNKPSWRHYGEMDAVMSRPIFSVRPNEVPAPSIKFQIEQELERRKERKRKILEEGGSISESEDEDIIDVLAFTEPKGRSGTIGANTGTVMTTINDIEIKKQRQHRDEKLKHSSSHSQCLDSKAGTDKQTDKLNDEELMIKMEIETEELIPVSGDYINLKSNKDSNNKGVGANTKHSNKNHTSNNNNNNNKDSVDDVLLVPKMEPIDVDAEDGSSCDSDMVPISVPSVRTIKSRKGTAPNADGSGSNKSSTSSVVTIPSTVAITHTKTITATTGSGSNKIGNSCNTNTHQGKISLVPTNFLMPTNVPTAMSSQPQIRLLPNASGQLQPHLVLSAATPTASTVTTNVNNTGIVTTGPGGMKLLLVNAEQAGQNNSNNTITALTVGNKGTIPTTSINNGTSNSNHQQIQQQQQLTVRSIVPQSTADEPQILQPSMQSSFPKRTHNNTQANTVQMNQNSDNKEKEPVKKTDKSDGTAFRKDFNGLRLLIGKLLNAQNKNNEYQKNRLDIERERLEFEKSSAEKFFSLFNQHLQQQSVLQQQVVTLLQQHQPQQQKQQSQYPALAPILGVTNPANTPISTTTSTQGQLRLNSKVFFTTGPSVVSGTSASFLTPSIITTACAPITNFVTPNSTTTSTTNNDNIQIVTSSSSDVSLSIPKTEPITL